MDQSSIIRSFAFVLGVALLLAVSWGAFKAVTEAKADLSKVDTVETLDTDIALANTIDSLEAHWDRRSNYHFNVKQDPLYLGRVILGFSYANQGFKETEEGTGLRLSATVTLADDSPMAIIKYDGKSFVLRKGDKFGKDYVVKDIQKKKVVLNRKGETITLLNKPIGRRLDESSQQGFMYPDEY